MRAPLTFVGEKYRKVTAVYPATDNQSCTCKLNLGDMKDTFLTVKELAKYLNIKGKTKLVRNKRTFKTGYKKAIITLKKGQSIDLATGI